MPTGFTYQEFEKAADGMHTITGIEKFITLDKNHPDTPPIFTMSPFNGRMQVGMELKTSYEGQGPVLYLTAAEFVAFVHMFGVTDFTPKNPHSSAVLLEGQQLINGSGKTLKATSKGGYAKNTVVMPEGKYKVKFNGFGDCEWKTLEFSNNSSEVIFAEFEVVEGVYKGFPFSVIMNRSFSKTPTGEVPELRGEVNVTRWENLIKYFAPSTLEHHWKTAVDSDFGIDERVSPQYVINKCAETDSTEAFMWYAHKRKADGTLIGVVELSTVNQHNDTLPTPKSTTSLQLQFTELIKSRPVWGWASEDGEEISVESESIFQTESPITFGPDGKVWAGEFLGGETGLWQSAGLDPQDKRFESLSTEQLESLIEVTKQRFAL